ncbi:MAG: DUF501 domain-containing protein [Acidimicrobiia bacterium]|nr:DUF501 domain-containing protein [Acidimicrobiia bacterium]
MSAPGAIGRFDRSDRSDYEAVTRLLGREPQGAFTVVVRRCDGSPVVLANEPLLDSGRPMPTRFWLVDRGLVRAVGRLESLGGVNEAEAMVDPVELQAAHDAYAAERDALIDAAHVGPRPHGGVGGTRTGVKCLHAHYANYLVGAADPVGRWVAERLAATGDAYDETEPGQ